VRLLNNIFAMPAGSLVCHGALVRCFSGPFRNVKVGAIPRYKPGAAVARQMSSGVLLGKINIGNARNNNNGARKHSVVCLAANDDDELGEKPNFKHRRLNRLRKSWRQDQRGKINKARRKVIQDLRNNIYREMKALTYLPKDHEGWEDRYELLKSKIVAYNKLLHDSAKFKYYGHKLDLSTTDPWRLLHRNTVAHRVATIRKNFDNFMVENKKWPARDKAEGPKFSRQARMLITRGMIPPHPIFRGVPTGTGAEDRPNRDPEQIEKLKQVNEWMEATKGMTKEQFWEQVKAPPEQKEVATAKYEVEAVEYPEITDLDRQTAWLPIPLKRWTLKKMELDAKAAQNGDAQNSEENAQVEVEEAAAESS